MRKEATWAISKVKPISPSHLLRSTVIERLLTSFAFLWT